MSARFAHLHLHSEYSLVDSTIRIPELVERCAALQQPAVAVTDQNNLFALVKFYKAAEGAGIKPIIGADVLLAEGNETASRVTLLCRDREGYLTLSRLLTRAWMEGHRTDGVVVRPDWLRESNAGLFALAGRHSEAGRLAAAGKHDLAAQWLADWQRHTDGRLHLELTRTQRDGEDAFNAFALHASSERGIPVIASNDVRFLDANGFEAHEARVCISTGRVLDDPKRPRDYSAEQFLKSSDQMETLFADVPDAIDNALALATRCNLELSLGTYYLPAFPVPANETLDSWIRSQSRDGLRARLDKHPPSAEFGGREAYDARLEAEEGATRGFRGVRGEDGTDVEVEHRALDIGGAVSLLVQLAHRPPHRRRLRLGVLVAAVRPGAPHAMHLLRRVDEEEEEGEGARRDGGQIHGERVHLPQQLLERRSARRPVPPRARGAAE